MDSFDKIIATLDLANSAARNETIKGIIESVLYQYNEPINTKDLRNLIADEIKLELYDADFDDCFNHLIELGDVVSKDNTLYVLSDNRAGEIRRALLKVSEDRNLRKSNFDKIIDELSEVVISTKDKDILWRVFTDYLYDCFLQNGKEAIYLFVPKRFSQESLDYNVESIIRTHVRKIDKPEIASLFKKLIEVFPSKLNTQDLQYLESLARKTESFYSLGLSREDYASIQDFSSLDWTLVLDTNFLYSILGLHSHPENQACKELIQLVKKNNLKLRFRFINSTLQELAHKKEDFEKSIPNDQFTPSQISALLQSEKLDSFSKIYYQNKLKDPRNTPHPTHIISNAQMILQSNSIERLGNSLEKKLVNDVNFLNARQSDYEKHIQYRNEIRAEKGFELKFKDQYQTRHDVILREVILGLRTGIRNVKINEVKYFGITLDKALIRFDRIELGRDHSGVIIPTFFLPSLLLRKLVKFLPVITDDYRRAFIGAISSSVLDSPKAKSSTIAQRSMQYFRNMGIEDKELILGLISNNVFLENFEKLSTPDEKVDFIQSEIDLKFTALKSELEEKERTSNELKERDLNSQKELQIKNSDLEQIQNSVKELQSRAKMYEKELTKLSKVKKEKIVVIQPALNFNESESIQRLEQENALLREKLLPNTSQSIVNWSLLSKRLALPFKRLAQILLFINFLCATTIALLGILIGGSTLKDYLSVAAFGWASLFQLIPKLKERGIFWWVLINLALAILYIIYLFQNYNGYSGLLSANNN